MMCYCYNDYQRISYGGYKSTEHTSEWDIIYFKSGEYYEHLGARQMKNHNGKIMSFGTLDNWKKYFLEPHEDRDRKLKLLEV